MSFGGGGFDFVRLRKVLPSSWNMHTKRETQTDFCLILSTVIKLLLKLN